MREIDSRSRDIGAQFAAEPRKGQGDPDKVGDDGLDVPAEVVVVMFVIFCAILLSCYQ